MVLLIVAGLLCGSGLGWYERLIEVGQAPLAPSLHWWLLLPFFALTEVVVVHLQVRREAQTVSLNEIPMVMALFLCAPVEALVASVLGSALIYVFHRRQSAIKALFNIALRIFGVTLTLVIFQELALLGTGQNISSGPAGWLAAVIAVAVTGAVDGVLVLAVIALHDGNFDVRDVWNEVVTYLPISALTACVGVIAAATLHADPRTGVPLIVVCCALFAGYRAHAALSAQHVNLAGLFAFGRSVTTADKVEDILGSVLHGARQLLRAEAAEVVLRGSRPGEPDRRWVLSAGASTAVRETLTDPGHPALWSTVLAGEGPLLLARGARDDDGQMARIGYREAIVVPLFDDSGVLGTLVVAERMGEVRTFDTADVEVLEAVANQTSLALQNGQLVDRLRHDALHDVLTGLPNRVRYRDAVDEALAALDRGGVDGFAAMLIDLDGFKEVNDSLGHQSGDTLLIHVADQLTRSAGPDATVARLGGDEFAVLLPTAASVETASETAARMLDAIGESVIIDGVPVQVHASIGISLAPSHAREATVLLRHADHAMYAAKANHGGIRIHDQEDAEPAGQSRLAILAELRQAISRRDITVHVQPQAHAGTGQVYGVEALIRWNHPQRGILLPSEFLPLATRHNLIHDLTEIVLDQAVAAAAAWREAGLDLSIAVNLSADSLTDSRILTSVKSALNRHGLPASRLTLEITEDVVISDPARAIAQLSALRDTGVRLSVDDFGTGYSSLSYLGRLPVNEVKIDRSFVTSLAGNVEDRKIVRSIIDLAHNLCLDVTAEGVEDQWTWDQLAELQCHSIQGHHLAAAMPIADLGSWLRSVADRVGPKPVEV